MALLQGITFNGALNHRADKAWDAFNAEFRGIAPLECLAGTRSAQLAQACLRKDTPELLGSIITSPCSLRFPPVLGCRELAHTDSQG